MFPSIALDIDRSQARRKNLGLLPQWLAPSVRASTGLEFATSIELAFAVSIGLARTELASASMKVEAASGRMMDG